MQPADDEVIFERAAAEHRIVVSADADFGTLLAASSSRHPSVIQFRGEGSRKPDALARTLLANLPQLVDALENGSIVTLWHDPSDTRRTNDEHDTLTGRWRSGRARSAFPVRPAFGTQLR